MQLMSKINFFYIKISESSFNELENWIKDLKENSSPDIKIILIGNKVDLEEFRKVKKEDAEKLKEDYEFDYFTEASAKTGFNAKEIFIKAAQILYDDYISYNNNNRNEQNDYNKVKVNNDVNNEIKKKKKCC
jgi:GTPase SAR1 family protein